MKIVNVVLPFIFSIISLISFAGTIVLEGKYQSKNLYIMNASQSHIVGFCAYEVTVNGVVASDEIASETFEIDFSALGIQVGRQVVVEINYKNDCVPIVLNANVLNPKITCEVVDLCVNEEGLLSWETIKESEKHVFIIEQYRWNKWIKVGEIKSIGNWAENTINQYQYQTTPHSQENTLRIKQQGFEGQEILSKLIKFDSNVEELNYEYEKSTSEIVFDKQTLYKVYDLYGHVLKSGYDKMLEMANLKEGKYIVCFDNKTIDIKRN